MDARNEIREFLTTRRGRITPVRAGLPAYGGGRRRVSGLRREEVALQAGISVEYYTRLERGDASGVSESVLEGLSRALQLDEAERTHLFDLVRTANAAGVTRRRTPQARVRPSVQRILDAMTDVPAFVLNARLDVLAANRLGDAFYSDLFADPVRPVNSARFVFLNPSATEFFLDWSTIANDTVGILRAEAGRDAYDRRLSDLIGELSTRSDEFRVRWAAHDVRLHRTGAKRIHHPLVGDLTLDFDSLELPGDPGQTLLVYTAEPDSPSRQALNLLASWTSTQDPVMAVDAHEEFSDQPHRTEP
jgi:transcriptional regulator with XRE-family HTH domain